jgi:hypothetical protein
MKVKYRNQSGEPPHLDEGKIISFIVILPVDTSNFSPIDKSSGHGKYPLMPPYYRLQ